ncbi:NeuD/PglB/VioB family sugar acetyltransferase [Hymenobacter terrestris]|uniref:NeuD/PglB/VioB family sugar acetyltransferase n=1 Tax=Hymenobacter terrestris TaxID=2748310 RepID=A0ABX2Q6Q9_9BACT|nr:NeuD/PglB/VioB family sugar acetyltransferase [Hymenobacter terrestris]NVO85922.1 NeuD/PglB/VioB family sugar acetyltransferase [Hymenobacter terrestris]
MLVIGARGHALEILQVIHEAGFTQDVYFFDNVNSDAPTTLFDLYPVLRTAAQAQDCLRQDPRFIIGIGGTQLREQVSRQMQSWGGELFSAVSPSASVGTYGVSLGSGLNIMNGVLINNEVSVGEGTMLNARATLHHNCQVGNYCEISPAAQLLGHVKVGDYSQVGAGAIVLPRVCIGKHVTIGAGAVVTRDVPDYAVAAGVPARVQRLQLPV